jgi:TolB-like protein/thioredoxin-like negative regulator of GroEL
VSFFQELKRRNVVRVGLAYAVVSWVVLQIIDVITPIFALPVWAPKLVFIMLAVGAIPALIFAWAFEITPEGLKKEADVDRSRSVAGATGRKLNYVIVAALVFAVVLLLAERQFVDRSDAPSLTEDTVAEVSEAKSIAVLPFVNMTSDPEQEYFSDGISEEILNSLAAVQELKVAGRTSSFAFKGKNEDLRLIGDALGVTHILEGSVRKAGDQVRITAQLIQVDNGFHLWSETYDRQLVDVFAIQDEISAEILKQLRLRLLNDSAVVAEADRTNPQAYELYLKARQRIYGRVGSEIELAVKELDKVIALDPQYAPAYAQRGIATMLLSEEQYGSLPVKEAHRRGKRFVDQALELNPSLAYGWAARGLYLSDESANAEEAIDALMKALEINPNLIDASNWLNNTLRDVGDMRGALEVITELVERDPFYRPAFGNAIQQFNSFGQTEKADELLQRMAGLDPDSPDILLGRSINYLFSGKLGESLQVMEERLALGSMSGVAKGYLSIGLIGTQQYQRALDEGDRFRTVVPLYELGREEEAYTLARSFAADGYPQDLFYLYLRDNREQALVDYVEERWPSVEVFAEENVGDEYRYDAISNLALAYQRLGNQQRFSASVATLDRHNSKMLEQGVTNGAFSVSVAFQQAMQGDVDAAFEQLQAAVEKGFSLPGVPTDLEPHFQLLADDPRYAGIEETMRANLNRNRAVIGLAPVDADYQAVME